MVRHGVCSYKKKCKACKLVSDADRPTLCIGLECEFYTPCSGCDKNLDLVDGICQYCIKKKHKQNKTRDALSGAIASDELTSVDGTIDESIEHLDDYSLEIPSAVDRGVGGTSAITVPGEPLPHYPESAKNYYLRQWNEYSGYYSDPTAYTVVHQIIILEIELSIVSTTLSKFISDKDIAPTLEKRRDKLIANLSALRRQLPSKEALELSDDEKSMAMVYKRYMEEKHADEFGKSKIRRILTPDAYALAPVLHYKMNPIELLTRLGYKIADPEKVSSMIDSPPDNPLDAAEFYGFRPREKYAKSVSKKFEEIHENEDDFDDDDDGLVV